MIIGGSERIEKTLLGTTPLVSGGALVNLHGSGDEIIAD